MTVRVLMFAAAKQLAGSDVVDVEIADSARVGDLRAALVETIPELAPLMPFAMFAVGQEYADDDSKLSPTLEIACIPPVSGG